MSKGPLSKPSGKVSGPRQTFSGQRQHGTGKASQPENQVRTRTGGTSVTHVVHAPAAPINVDQHERTHGETPTTVQPNEAAREVRNVVIPGAAVEHHLGHGSASLAPFSPKRHTGME